MTPATPPIASPARPLQAVMGAPARTAPPAAEPAGAGDRLPPLFWSAARRLAVLSVPVALLWLAVAWAVGGPA